MDFIKFVYNCTKSPPRSPSEADLGILNEVLHNDLLIELIFEKLKNRDLKSCRLVCSKWDCYGAKRIRKNYFLSGKMLTLMSDDEIKNFIKTFGHDPGSILHNSIKLSLTSDTSHFSPTLLKEFFIIFRNKFENLSLRFSYNTTKELGNILRVQSQSLIELRICSRDPTTSHKFEFPNFLLPKLKCLVLTENYDGWKEEYGIGQQHILEELLAKIPKENSVDICLRLWERIGDTTALLERFEHIKSLRVLDTFEIEGGELKQLADAGVRLKFLTVDSGPLHIDVQVYTDNIHEFLCHQSMSLEMLAWANPIFKFPPTMPALRKLRLNCEYDDDLLPGQNGPQVQVPILYGELFPNLEELHLISDVQYEQSPTSFRSQFLHSQIPCTSLKTLDVRYSQLSTKTMKQISGTFSTITSLRIWHYRKFRNGRVGQRKLYSAIWNSNFADTLEELVIDLDDGEDPNVVKRSLYKLDHIFSGVPEAEISAAIISNTYTENYDRPNYNSILKLKNLKTLKVFATSGWKVDSFTDFSAFCIFGKMKKLEYLHLDKVIRKFTKAGLQHLRNTFVDSPVKSDEERIERISETATEFYSDKPSSNLLKHEPRLQCESDSDMDDEDDYWNDFHSSDPEDNNAPNIVEESKEPFGLAQNEEFLGGIAAQGWDSDSESEMIDWEQQKNGNEEVSDSERSLAEFDFSHSDSSDTEESRNRETCADVGKTIDDSESFKDLNAD